MSDPIPTPPARSERINNPYARPGEREFAPPLRHREAKEFAPELRDTLRRLTDEYGQAGVFHALSWFYPDAADAWAKRWTADRIAQAWRDNDARPGIVGLVASDPPPKSKMSWAEALVVIAMFATAAFIVWVIAG